MTRPTFFFSHARRDTESPGRYLLKFFRDLDTRISSWTPEPPPYGTIDRRIPHGSDWDDHLSSALAGNTAFLAVLTPLYGTRVNCGKELGVFLARSSGLGVDVNGQLRGVQNVLPIQWMPRSAYAVNAEKDALIPVVLRRIEDVPAVAFGDTEAEKAIERYRQFGMERCVSPGARYYERLLDIFAQRIVQLPALPPTAPVDFAAAVDAFRNDWTAQLGGRQTAAAPRVAVAAPRVAEEVALRPLDSLVVFHVTELAYQVAASRSVLPFTLIADPEAEPAAATDPTLAQLLDDVRNAAAEVKMTVVHAIATPAQLEEALSSLTREHVLVAVIVDRSLLPGDAVLQALGSPEWRGAVFRTSRATLPDEFGHLALPDDRVARYALLRWTFVEIRGAAMSAGADRAANAERLPMLKSSPPEST